MASKLIASELAKISHLNGPNYDMWHRKIKFGLIHDNLDSVIENPAPTLSETPTAEEKKELEKWKVNDKKARSLMLMFMEDNLIKVFETCQTAHEMWTLVKEKYDTTSEVNVQNLMDRYISCSMAEGDSVTEHVNNMIVMAKDLATAGSSLPESLQVAVVLNSLPRSLDMAATAIRMGKTVGRVSDLPLQLSIEQEVLARRKTTDVNLVQEEVNAVQFQKGQGSRRMGPAKHSFKGKGQQHNRSKKGPPGSCHICGKFGHFKAACPQAKNKGKRPEQGGFRKPEFIGVTECNAVTVDAAGWWIDSGATRHIAKYKEGATDFKELKKGEQRIYMGNNTYLDVEGVASYRLDLGDNIMVLKDVFYAPGIRRNLISVPALLKKGLEVRFYNNRVSIGKEKKVFAMGKFVPEHDLFCLSVENPIVENNNDSALNYFSCSLSDYDLWHMRI